MSKLHITHLVFSGGGMHGVMYIGALRYLYLEGLLKNVTHVAGTSIGSFIGLFVALKLNMDEIETIMYNVLYKEDFNFIPRKNYLKLVSNLGLTSTKTITQELKNVLKSKYDIEDITFRELAQRFGINMYISATNIISCTNTVFSVDTTPDLSVLTASEASMSIPFLYIPVIIDDIHYYDGGLSNNFPVKIFSNVPQENILGMVLHKENKPSDDAAKETVNIFFLAKQIFNILNAFRVKEVTYRQLDCINNLYIPDNIPFKNFMNFKVSTQGIKLEITTDDINAMIYAGFDSMHKYMETRLQKVEEQNNKLLIQADTKDIST
jgi:predicted acylesterase/phospholipase RssA